MGMVRVDICLKRREAPFFFFFLPFLYTCPLLLVICISRLLLQQGTPPSQRGGESFARKRDRAKLLRQQMNDGLDNLHEVSMLDIRFLRRRRSR